MSPETSPATIKTLSSPSFEAESLTLSLPKTENGLLITRRKILFISLFKFLTLLRNILQKRHKTCGTSLTAGTNHRNFFISQIKKKREMKMKTQAVTQNGTNLSLESVMELKIPAATQNGFQCFKGAEFRRSK